MITDINGTLINIYLAEGNDHDAQIIIKQLDNFINSTNIKRKNNNIFIGDAER